MTEAVGCANFAVAIIVISIISIVDRSGPLFPTCLGSLAFLMTAVARSFPTCLGSLDLKFLDARCGPLFPYLPGKLGFKVY